MNKPNNVSGNELIQRFAKAHSNDVVTKQEGSLMPIAFQGIILGVYKTYMSKYYEMYFGPIISVHEGIYGAVFFNLIEYREVCKITYKQFLEIRSEENLKQMKDFELLKKKIDKLYKEYSPEKLSGFDSAKLGNLIHDFLVVIHEILACTVFCEGLDEPLERELYKELEPSMDGFEEFFSNVSLPTFESFVTRADKLLLAKGDKDLYGVQWIFADYGGVPGLDEIKKLVVEKLKSLGSSEKAKTNYEHEANELKKNKKEFDDYVSKLDHKKKLLMDYSRLAVNLRDFRKGHIQKIITPAVNAVRELFSKNNIPLKYVPYFLEQDFFSSRYKEKEYADELASRYKGFLLYFESGKITPVAGNAKQWFNLLFNLVDKNASSESVIKGSIACKGKVTGPVRIVLSVKEFGKFKQGDILVTSMTRPEFVPIMKKAAGLVTDEGGVTSHAAIVSRELGIPCIIGTGNATRILKDGDIVEVDANKGVVRKI